MKYKSLFLCAAMVLFGGLLGYAAMVNSMVIIVFLSLCSNKFTDPNSSSGICSRFAGSEVCDWESLELIQGRCLGVVDSEEVTLT